MIKVLYLLLHLLHTCMEGAHLYEGLTDIHDLRKMFTGALLHVYAVYVKDDV